MKGTRIWPYLFITIFIVCCLTKSVLAQQPLLQTLTWRQVREKFEAENPTLKANLISIEESRAQEITAYLRPNPEFSFATDGTQLTPAQGVWQPLVGTQFTPGISYLHERGHKRELRRDAAQQGTAIQISQTADQERGLLFTLRSAFVQALQMKAVLELAKANLEYYDRLLLISRDRLRLGDIAQIDMDRIELQRVQYESDLQTATVNLRTAKIQLLTLLNDRAPVEQFDITGPFDAYHQIQSLEEYRKIALVARPDLRAAEQSIIQAETNYKLAVANGSTDPTFSMWVTHNPSFNNPFDNETLGMSMSIPLRIFDRNQGEKLRTKRDIERNERLRDVAIAQIYSDVDSAYATLSSNLILLQRYKSTYLDLAVRVRETITFAFQRGGASLLDFLQAQQEYRTTQLTYINLIGSYLTAAAQLNQAVGQEVLQ